jgi:hypothetical protein
MIWPHQATRPALVDMQFWKGSKMLVFCICVSSGEGAAERSERDSAVSL